MGLQLNKETTSVIKGVAILLMIFHHLYGFYGLALDTVLPALENAGVAFMHNYAACARACVGLFAFVTGYGYYIKSLKDDQTGIKAGFWRMRRFYPIYVIYCLFFIVLSFIAPCPPYIDTVNWKRELGSIVGIGDAIPDYWYIGVVLLTSLVCYPILLCGQRHGNICHLFLFFFVLALSQQRRELIGILNSFCPIPVTCISWLEALPWLVYFLLGWGVAVLLRQNRLMGAVMITACVLAVVLGNDLRRIYLSVVVCVVFASVGCQYVPARYYTWLVLLGNYSACMWLNHRLIFGYWFAGFFYALPTPVNFMLLVLLSFIASYVFMKLWDRAVSHLSRLSAKAVP